MSNTPPGPGWWLASDGNWYPPAEAAPPEPPTPPPAPGADAPTVPTSPPSAPTTPMPQHLAPTQMQPPVAPPPGVWGQPPAQAGTPGQPPLPGTAQPTQGYPPPGPPAAPAKSKLPWILGAVAVFVIGGLVAALLVLRGDDDDTVASDDLTGEQLDDQTKMTVDPDGLEPVDDPADVEIQNDDGSEVNSLIADSIVDLQEYWDGEMPATFDQEFQAISGGYWAWTSDVEVPPCAESVDQIMANAYYCSVEDNIAWDADGLLPSMLDAYGPVAVGAIMAHEWGHAVQARIAKEAATVTLEQQADCFAGAWVAHLEDEPNDSFPLSDETIDGALAAILEVADQPGTAATDPSAHGSAFDRANAFQDGIGGGTAKCAEYEDETMVLVELPFTDQDDYDRGGNLPYEQIMELTFTDLEDYWSKALPQFFEAEWTPLAGGTPFDPSSGSPACGGDDTSGYALYYCVPDDTIVWDDVDTMPTISDRLGDFAVSTLIGTQYGLAVMTRLGVETDDARTANLAADCLAGAWASSVFSEDRAETASLVLSPGDLDEAVKVLLAFGEGSETDTGTGFDRVASFRNGVLNGPTACLE